MPDKLCAQCVGDQGVRPGDVIEVVRAIECNQRGPEVMVRTTRPHGVAEDREFGNLGDAIEWIKDEFSDAYRDGDVRWIGIIANHEREDEDANDPDPDQPDTLGVSSEDAATPVAE